MKKYIWFLIGFLFILLFFWGYKKQYYFIDRYNEIINFLYEKDILSSPIPKKIHYVWVGGEETADVKKIVASWKEKMPDYEIKKWDETTCNISANAFVREAYDKKMWSYVSDWCRLEALLNEGGIYLDVDTYINKSLKPLLKYDLVLTLERKESLSAGIIAVKKNHPFIKNLMDYYQGFYGWFPMPAPEVWTAVFNEIKKDLKSYHIYPTSVLMLKFHEKENYAKHFYSTGSGKNVSRSKWYIFYENLFVEQNGIFLKWEKDESWVFFYDDNKYYIVTKDEKEGFKLTGEEGFYQKTDPINELYFLTLKNKNGEKKIYSCIHHNCVKH